MAITTIVRIDANTPMIESLGVAPEKLLTASPAQGLVNLYSDPGDEFHCGLWQSEPGAWRVSYSEHEFCHLLSGRVRITDEAGAAMEVAAGDSFMIPAGFSGTWEVLEPARKIYVIFERSAST